MKNPFSKENLPPVDMLPNPTVTLTREQVIRFRKNYAELGEHTAELCNKLCDKTEVTPQNLCLLHIMAASQMVDYLIEENQRLEEALDACWPP